ncbi:OmpH family outer membrane protein [Mucilaginibacter myungsuensis]|uniref:OmpH family outer membrane protein n=1 Tax=Mucilaginibacter myungsuensis TaxID=649104 RepID=A0A929KXC2_9SPHI|nr:OmpH family outer membrane protein [Mucilaginibacter myungsuensis]MBE9662387.1 OmpH family outer membrane protein [Mucilaginibacter myungsuensis]MDN3599176.1 OmpH family outer membrane protein [Mucilaginibacter myungsuensis]
MKKSAANVAKITLGLVISATIFACNQKPAETKTATPAAAVPVDAKATIVYINQDSISEKYQAAIDMRKRLEEKGKTLKGQVDSRQQSLQRAYVDAQKNAASMTQEQQQALGQKLQRDQGSFQEFQQRANADFQNTSADETKALYDKIVDFTKTYAKDKGYKLILTYQNGNTTVLYGDPSLDVTADFIKKLNDAYKK